MPTVNVERLLHIILNKFTLMGLRQSEINNSKYSFIGSVIF